MSQLEELVYSALEHGKRDEMFEEIAKIRTATPNLPLEQLYNMAYQEVMKT